MAAISMAALGQLLTISAMALIARHYSDEQLSEYGVFIFLLGLMQIISSLRLEQGIVYQRTQSETISLTSASLLALFPSLLLCGTVSYMYLMFNPQTHQRAGVLVALLIGSALFANIAKILTQIIARQERFYALACANAMRPALIALAQIILLGFVSGFCQLPLALLLSQFIFALLCYCILSIHGRPQLLDNMQRTIAAIKKNKAFVYFSLPQNMIFVLSDALLPLSLPFLFTGSEAVALFWLASKTVFAPATVFAESIRAMVYRTIARGPRQDIFKSVALTSLGMASVIAFPVIVLAVYGEYLFELVYGAGWGAANSYAVILGCLVIGNTAALPFVGALPILGLQNHLLLTECLGFVVRASVLYGVHWSSPVDATLWCTAAYLFVLFCFLTVVAVTARKQAAEA